MWTWAKKFMSKTLEKVLPFLRRDEEANTGQRIRYWGEYISVNIWARSECWERMWETTWWALPRHVTDHALWHVIPLQSPACLRVTCSGRQKYIRLAFSALQKLNVIEVEGFYWLGECAWAMGGFCGRGAHNGKSLWGRRGGGCWGVLRRPANSSAASRCYVLS